MKVNENLADALWYGKRDIIDKYLARHGSIPPHPTCLAAACKSGMADIVTQLLDAGCAVNWDPEMESCSGSALALAAEYGHTPIIGLLLKKGAAPEGNAEDDFSPLYHCVSNDDLRGIRQLIRAGADMHRQLLYIDVGPQYDSPYELAKREHPRAASLLETHNQLTTKQRLSQKRRFMNAEMFRWCSDEGRNLDAFIVLYGADMNALDENGETLLHHAVRKEDEKLTWKLMYYGADTKIKNKDGMTPLELDADLREKDKWTGFRSDKVNQILTEKPKLFPHAAHLAKLLRHKAPRADIKKGVELLKKDPTHRNALDEGELFLIVHKGFDPEGKLQALIAETRENFETGFCCRHCGRFTLDRGALTAGSDLCPAASNEPEWNAYCHSCGGNTTVWR